MNEPGARRRRVGVALGIVAFALTVLLWRPDTAAMAAADGSPPDAFKMAVVAALALLMATWWITEALPIPVTSLLPMALLPLFAGAPFDIGRVAANYSNWQVYLFFGGFLLAIAMESSGLHRRVALGTVAVIGTRPRRIILGFMVASAVLSMWISNTATALMMLPIGRAVTRRFEGRQRFAEALMLGIAYGCSIGGVATPIGTPPNIAFFGVYARTFPDGPPISFASWMAFAVPLSAVLLLIAWAILALPVRDHAGDASDVLAAERRSLGPMTTAERRVLIAFLTTAALWVFREPIVLGALRVPGWSAWLPRAEINDAVVAMAMGTLLFLIPAGRGAGPLLTWDAVRDRMPWGILLLFGGGFALADALAGSGLSAWLGSGFSFLQGLPLPIVLLAAVTLLTFLTEVTSNAATAQVMLPIAAAAAVGTLEVDPRILMIPVALAASFAFMLPVATPPNAVVFASESVRLETMARRGLQLNLAAIVILTLLTWWLAPSVFGIDPGAGVPPWAAGR